MAGTRFKQACAAGLMILLGACSTAADQAASTDADRAGFVPSAPAEKSGEPPIVTAGDLVQQRDVPAPAAESAKAKPAPSKFELSAGQVAALIAQSRAEFSGECPCPYDEDKSGASCGKRSAYSKTGASTVLCYPKDVLGQ
jgi:hypothetical protein